MDNKNTHSALKISPTLGVKFMSFGGKFGSGKNYIAETLVVPRLRKMGYNVLILSFADHLKVDAVTKKNVDFDKVFADKRDEKTRILLQQMGTEQGRNVYGDDIWLKTLETWIRVHASRGVDYVVNCDGRFANECEWVQKHGGFFWRIEAPKRTWARAMKEANGNEEKARNLMAHPSETSMDSRPDLYNVKIQNDIGQEEEAAKQVADVFDLLEPDASNASTSTKKRKLDDV